MEQFKEVLRLVRDHGDVLDNRTATPAISFPGAFMRFDLQEDGFPALTLKRLPFKSVVGELCAFMRAAQSAADFRALGSKVWDQNANENKAWLANPFRKGVDDLGPVYGAQWRNWPAFTAIDHAYCDNPSPGAAERRRALEAAGWQYAGVDHDRNKTMMFKSIDQLRECIDLIWHNPTNRRILFHGWNPAALHEIALPACHLLYQFHANPKKRELSLSMYVRSNDLGLGAPFNMAEGGALLCLFARLTGYAPKFLNYHIGDAHIYVNHLDMVEEMLARESRPLPTLHFSDRINDPIQSGEYDSSWLERIEPADFILSGYDPHDAIKADMAV